MDLEFLASLGWREALVAVVALLALYILYAFLRINRLHREAQHEAGVSPELAQEGLRSYAAVQDPVALDNSIEPPTQAMPQAQESPFSSPERTFPWNEPPDNAEHSALQKIVMLEQEVAQLRRELGALRSEIQTLREERRLEASQTQAVPPSSPFYGEAMQLAAQGRESSDISTRCGISRAEADLVVALVKNKTRASDQTLPGAMT